MTEENKSSVDEDNLGLRITKLIATYSEVKAIDSYTSEMKGKLEGAVFAEGLNAKASYTIDFEYKSIIKYEKNQEETMIFSKETSDIYQIRRVNESMNFSEIKNKARIPFRILFKKQNNLSSNDSILNYAPTFNIADDFKTEYILTAKLFSSLDNKTVCFSENVQIFSASESEMIGPSFTFPFAPQASIIFSSNENINSKCIYGEKVYIHTEGLSNYFENIKYEIYAKIKHNEEIIAQYKVGTPNNINFEKFESNRTQLMNNTFDLKLDRIENANLPSFGNENPFNQCQYFVKFTARRKVSCFKKIFLCFCWGLCCCKQEIPEIPFKVFAAKINQSRNDSLSDEYEKYNEVSYEFRLKYTSNILI